MKLKSAMFWIYLVVILYLVSMLVYVSVEFFGGADTNKIAAFGSVLGGVGTLFAGFVAIYLFNDWREQHNKNIESQLCMKAFDYIQGFEFELIDIERFTILYLVNPNKSLLHKKFNNNLERLNIIADKSSVVLSDLGFFIPKKEYDEKFKPQFDIIIDQLEQYIHIYDSTFRFYTPRSQDKEFIQKYRELTAGLRDRYRATFVELNEYYKAL